ncbi:MAG: Gfo/Idh/MocA family oxidoreductase [Bacteroidales bacterium]|nr:Gfo/Idh/MocA family oxidoreductase [Bacteroidales bacterium]
MIRVAIAGSGRIVPQMLEAMQTVPGYEVVAICGRTREKASRFGIPDVYTDYAQMLARPDIDFVYIALPNSLHFEAAKQALLAGRNVLCEKPFTSTVAQAEELFALAAERGLWIFEAISNIHLPNFRKVQELLPQIGPVRLVHADYDEHFPRYDQYLGGMHIPVFTHEYEGGALRDINIYCLHIILALYGRPDKVFYASNACGPNAVGTSGAATLVYDSGLVAVCTASMDSEGPHGFYFQGERGALRVYGLPNFFTKVELLLPGAAPQVFELNRYEHRLCHQLEDYRDIYERGDRAAAQRLQEQTLLITDTLVRCEASETR